MPVAELNRDQSRIDVEASEWLARRRLPGLTAREEAQFEAWKQADPRHGAAFEAMSRTLETIASLKSLAGLESLEPADRRRRLLREPMRVRRAVAALTAVAAALVAFVAVPGLLEKPDLDAATDVAEVRVVRLADGSRVTLGARSRIQVQFAAGERRVKLTDGEAFFEVAHDTSRPFFVETGGAVVRVVGTKFDVKRAAGRVEVAVLEGVVEVRERALLGAGERKVLTAGQRVQTVQPHLAALAAPISQIGTVERAAAAAGSWREGQLTYDDTRLSDLVADLNRYYAPGVRLDSRSLGDTRLAASFKVGEIDKFLRDLPSAVPVAVARDGAGEVTITQRDDDPAS